MNAPAHLQTPHEDRASPGGPGRGQGIPSISATYTRLDNARVVVQKCKPDSRPPKPGAGRFTTTLGTFYNKAEVSNTTARAGRPVVPSSRYIANERTTTDS
ncbi:hypothetical protein EVAR_86953_1 [Eumeta japonica]|uniref:Uncharacterized protein n=1 Tax=Eumeta variegata TaxID=151549 RepID=A0A4C1W737_EUMVA|nr:hypothetical protein EVAR_86953_1 [Eumeta japonica]